MNISGCGTLPRMKLKKPETVKDEAPAAAPGGAVISARFRLDAEDAQKNDATTVGRTSTLVALIAALAALGAIGFAAWLMFSDWSVASIS